jgi:gamma-glutamylcyclotransferase (GGCT)/AIG2-like uncharacterized protein YtfP
MASEVASLPAGWRRNCADSRISEKLPFFVYGTLQSGFQNHDNFVRGRFTELLPAYVTNAKLRHYAAGFPGLYFAADESARVLGQLLVPPADVYSEVLRDLDKLEDYTPGDSRNMYERVVCRAVVTAAGCAPRAVDAWVYVSLLPESTEGETVLSGDWREWMSSRSLKDAADDWAEKLGAVGVTTASASTTSPTASD